MVSCSDGQGIVGTLNKVKRALPLEMRKRLNEVFTSYLVRYGIEGVYERLNNRTVAQIFAEYQPVDLKVITSGEVGGVRYRLYDAPPCPTDGKGGEEDAQGKT